MTQEQLDLPRLRELALKAMPGPWKADGSIYEHMIAEIRSVLPGSERGIGLIWQHANGFADAKFIAAANPATVLALLDLAESAGRMREALFIAAPQHQGGNGITGWVISQALGVPHPIECKDLVSKARDEGRDPAKLWPWLVKMRPGFFTTEELAALSPAQSTEGEEGQ